MGIAWCRGTVITAFLGALALSGCAASGPGGRPAVRSSSLMANVAAAAPGVASSTTGPITSLTGPIVALGDSYTAGDLLPLDLSSVPFGCYRSPRAYPQAVATALHDRQGLDNVACSTAGAADIMAAQRTRAGTNPPQADALSGSDQLVLLTLGGDDLGFLNVLDKCMALSWTNPWGSPCERHYTSGGTDQLAALVSQEAPKMTAGLAEIHAHAPSARVVLVGYPDLFPVRGGCWPAVPITDGDIGYLRGIEVQLNTMLATAARATGTTFVDTYNPTIGHDFCSAGKVRYVEGLVPGSLTAPFHPNAKGQAAIAGLVLKALAAG
jgi:lysophospholipase L1-like esterase